MLPLSTKRCLNLSKLRPILNGQFCHVISKNICLNVSGSKQLWEKLVFVIFKLLFWIICSCSNYLKYMENFDYWSILVDSGSIVQCKGTREKTFSYQHHLSILFKDRTAPNVGHISNFVKRMRIALFQSCVSRWEQKKRKQILLVEQENIKLF